MRLPWGPRARDGIREGERLTALDATFLFLDRPGQPFHIGCLAILERSLPLEALINLLTARLCPLPRFRQLPVRSALDLSWPVWRDVPHFDVARHVRHAAAPPPGDRDALAHLVETLYSAPLPPDRPLWEIHLIDGLEGGRAALLCKVHHCMSDGIAGFRVLEALADDVAGAARDAGNESSAAQIALDAQETSHTAGRPAAELPRSGHRRSAEPSSAVGGAPRSAERDRMDRNGRADGPLTALSRFLEDLAQEFRHRTRELVHTAGTLTRFVEEPAAVVPFNGRLGSSRRVVWRSFPFEELASLRTAAACTINDAALAIIAGALRRHLADSGTPLSSGAIRAVVPASLRDEDDASSLGNQVTAVFPRLPVEVADPIVRLHHVREEMRHLKASSAGSVTTMLLAVAGALPAATEAAVLRAVPDWPLVNTLCTNIPGPKRPFALAGRRVLDLHPIGPLFLNVGLAFAVASYGGRVSITAIADPELVPDTEAIGDAIEEALYETRRALWERSQALSLAAKLAAAEPTVAELMTRDVRTVRADESLDRAHEIMREARVRHVPVVDPTLRPLGVLTHRDLLFVRAAGTVSALTAAAALDREPPPIGAPAMVALPHERALEAGRRMLAAKLDCLPVVDDTGRFLGLVTGEHLLRWTTAPRGPSETKIQ